MSSRTLHQVPFYQLHDQEAKPTEELVLSPKLWIHVSESLGPDPKPGTGALYGHQWEPWKLAEWNFDAGFTNLFDCIIMTCIDLAESQGFDHAIHVNKNGTRDRGVKQLNSVHEDVTDEMAYSPKEAASWAYNNLVIPKRKAGKVGFEDWAAFTTDVCLHDSYVGRALKGVCNYSAQVMLDEPVSPWLGKAYVHRFKRPIVAFQHQLEGTVHHVESAEKALGWGAASAAKVQATREELGRARTAAKRALPE